MKPTESDEAKSGCFRSLTKCFKLRNSVGVNDHDIEDLSSPIVNVSSDENNDEKTKSSSENKHEIGNFSIFLLILRLSLKFILNSTKISDVDSTLVQTISVSNRSKKEDSMEHLSVD
jgi:hypothetical protein